MRKLRDVMADRARAAEDDRDLYSRSDARSERMTEATALLKVAAGLAELSPKQLLLLDVSEELQRAVLEARAIESPGAKARQLKIVRRVLKDCDWEQVQTRLEALRSPTRHNPAPVSVATQQKRKVAELAASLIAGGDPALAELCQQYATADRAQLRQLIRNARPQEGAEPTAPLRKLTLALAALVRDTAP